MNKGKTPAARRREAVPPTRGAKCRYAACAKLSIPPLSLWRLAKRSQDCSLPHMTACWCISNQTTLIVFDTSESSADLWGSPMDRVHKKQDSLSRAPNAELGIGCVCVCARKHFFSPCNSPIERKKKGKLFIALQTTTIARDPNSSSCLPQSSKAQVGTRLDNDATHRRCTRPRHRSPGRAHRRTG